MTHGLWSIVLAGHVPHTGIVSCLLLYKACVYFPFGECLNKAQPYRGHNQGSHCAVISPSEPCHHLALTQTISTTAL
jgi:hypothetical protein